MASQQYDVWAVTSPVSDADFYATAANGATSVTLVNTTPSVNGVGFKATVTSDGDETGITFTLTGTASNGASLTEVVTGPNATTSTSTNYFAAISGVSVNAATTGNVTVGYASTTTTGFTLPRTRVKGLYYVGATNAGQVLVTRASDSRQILNLATPAGSGAFADSLFIAAEGLTTAKTTSDSATVTAVNLTSVTLICG